MIRNLKFASFVILVFCSISILNSQNKTKNEQLDLNEYLGARLYKVFEVFGAPYDVFCSADGKSETILDFGTFAFQVGNKSVSIVYFWDNFQGSIFDVSIGMSLDDIFQKHGKPTSEKQSTIDGNLIWIYNLVKTDRIFVIFFDKDKKIARMQIEWII